MLLDIVILPPEQIRNKIGEKMKETIEHLPNYFVVDNVKLIPHLSLWHLNTSEKKITVIESKLRNIIRGHKPLQISSQKFRISPKYEGFLEFPIENSTYLSQLQQQIFENVYRFKTAPMPPFASFLNLPYSKEKLEEIEKYGRPIKFEPHFTMGWIKNNKDIPQVEQKMVKEQFSFSANEIYIAEVDDWWQVKRIIKKIDFKP